MKLKDIWKIIGWIVLILVIGRIIWGWGYTSATAIWIDVANTHLDISNKLLDRYSECQADRNWWKNKTDWWINMSDNWKDLYYQCDVNRDWLISHCK